MAIGYEVFWEKRQYWRVFTAAFSHYEHHHLCMNAFGIWNVREFETMLGTFRYLCLVSDKLACMYVLSHGTFFCSAFVWCRALSPREGVSRRTMVPHVCNERERPEGGRDGFTKTAGETKDRKTGLGASLRDVITS